MDARHAVRGSRHGPGRPGGGSDRSGGARYRRHPWSAPSHPYRFATSPGADADEEQTRSPGPGRGRERAGRPVPYRYGFAAPGAGFGLPAGPGTEAEPAPARPSREIDLVREPSLLGRGDIRSACGVPGPVRRRSVAGPKPAATRPRSQNVAARERRDREDPLYGRASPEKANAARDPGNWRRIRWSMYSGRRAAAHTMSITSTSCADRPPGRLVNNQLSPPPRRDPGGHQRPLIRARPPVSGKGPWPGPRRRESAARLRRTVVAAARHRT